MNHQEQQQTITAKATEVWAGFDQNERTGARFGMFPAGKMQAAEADLQAAGCDRRDVGRLLASALMSCK